MDQRPWRLFRIGTVTVIVYKTDRPPPMEVVKVSVRYSFLNSGSVWMDVLSDLLYQRLTNGYTGCFWYSQTFLSSHINPLLIVWRYGRQVSVKKFTSFYYKYVFLFIELGFLLRPNDTLPHIQQPREIFILLMGSWPYHLSISRQISV